MEPVMTVLPVEVRVEEAMPPKVLAEPRPIGLMRFSRVGAAEMVVRRVRRRALGVVKSMVKAGGLSLS
jgi:hypothetical protein